MRKAILLTAAAAFIAVPAVGEAQDGATTADVSVSAFISGFAEFDQAYDLDLDFAPLAADASELDRTINTNGAGALELQVSYNTNFAFNLNGGLSALTRDEGGSIAFTLLCEWVAGPTPSASGTSGCALDEVPSPEFTAGTGSLFIGGILGDLSNAPSGTYSGDLKIDIDVIDS